MKIKLAQRRAPPPPIARRKTGVFRRAMGGPLPPFRSRDTGEEKRRRLSSLTRQPGDGGGGAGDSKPRGISSKTLETELEMADPAPKPDPG